MPNIDYSAFTEPLTAEELTAYRDAAPTGERRRPLQNAIVVSLVAIFFLIPILFQLAESGASPATLWGVMALAIAAGVVGSIFWWREASKTQARIFKFAHINGLEYIPGQSSPGYPGMIFAEPNGKITSAFRFPGRAEIGNYTYTTGSGRNRRTHNYGYVRFKLTRRLPHMVLDTKSNNFLGITNLSHSFKRSQTISLEGDFDNYYTLYAPEQYGIDARYVFTPDVMASLVDHGNDLDMEIVDDELYIYKDHSIDLTSETELTSLLHIVDVFGAEVRDQSANYSDDRIGKRTANVVAPEGKRLKPGWSLAAMGALLWIAFNFLDSFVGAFSPEASIVLTAVFWLAVILIVVYRFTRRF